MNRFTFSLLFVILLSASATTSFAQGWSATEKKELAKKEDSLKKFSQMVVFAPNPGASMRADSNLVRTLVRALKIKNSFYYPFDSVSVSRVYAPDSSFRIFTWQWQKDDYVIFQKGAIQMRTADGSLQLFPLHDVSMFTRSPVDSVRTNLNWIGAIYYRIIQKEYNGRQYYTLLGFDDFSVSSNKKWMEVLHFENGMPLFGGPFISFKEDSVKRPVSPRFNIEYKKEAKAFFNYDPENDLIVYDHLVSESDEPSRKETLVPDGDYEGFKWMNGQWIHIEKVFHFKLKDGQFPMEEKLLDDAGNNDEEKLQKATDKNLQNRKATEKKAPAKKKGSS